VREGWTLRRDQKKTGMGKSALYWLVFVVGLLIMALGLVLLIKADLGSAPWDVFHIGLFIQLGLTIGTWSIIVGFFIIVLSSLLMKSMPQLGLFLNMVLVGIFIDFYMALPFMETPDTLFYKMVMLIAGIVINGIGIGLYIAADKGAGPRDSLMLALTEVTGWKVQWIRGSMEVLVLIFGWLLGGPVFMGTVLFSLSIGSIVGVTLPYCKKIVDRLIERGVWVENINKRTVRFNDYDRTGKKAR
jgi:uncharacterized membrane protein YczE